MRENQLLFTYLHLAPEFGSLNMLERKVTGVAYETITDKQGRLPAAYAMSKSRDIVGSGRATYLEKMNAARILSRVPEFRRRTW